MKRKKELIIILSSLLVIVLSVSVAYFTTKILGTEKDISVTSADLKVIFTSGSGEIKGTNIEPGWTSGENTFTVKNESNGTYKYNIIIKDLVNTFTTSGFLVYKITSVDGGYNMTDFADVPKSSTAIDTVLAENISISKGTTHTYTVEFKYLESEDVDQSADMGKKLSGKIFIEESKFKGGTLSEAIKFYNPTISTRSDFSTAFTTNTANTLYKATENGTDVYYFAGGDRTLGGECTYNGNAVMYFDGTNIASINNKNQCLSSKVCTADGEYVVGEIVTEDFCTSEGAEWTGENATWYEDGSITVNNWVKFGKYQNDLIKYKGYYSTESADSLFLNKDFSTMEECTSDSTFNKNCTEVKYYSAGDDMYWRIIRTNADGSIRLLYSGTSPDTTTGYIGTTAFSMNGDSPKYLGYMYGDTDATLDEARTNTNDSLVKTFVDNWYENNFTAYTNYLSNDAIYCNDRELASGFTYTNGTTQEDMVYFKSSDRLNKDKQPTYDCTNTKDAFSGNNSEAKLKYPVALMTADELAYAGSIFKSNNKINLWFDMNSQYNTIAANTFWWTSTPYYYQYTEFYSVLTTANGIFDVAHYKYNLGVRPVTSLKSCVQWKSGNGSATSPYEIALNGGC